MLGLQIVLFFIYLLFKNRVPVGKVSLRQQITSALWLIGFYSAMIILSYLGTFGDKGIIPAPWDIVAVAVISLIAFYWGIPKAVLPTEDED
ncbi:hypothetical protein [Photorhabdus cinerea]|uniref:hypothetical protein n=1 Tax=Photorhabdus cinerea TaxID=471575 RepID=UPI002418598C|nr:hypothetical protein [Photorhabdus cinerea]